MAEKLPYFVTRNDAAILLKISGPRVTQYTKPGCKFDGAKVDGKIDMNHHGIQAYAASKGLTIKRSRKDATGSGALAGAKQADKLGEWTLNKIVAKHGTDVGFKTWLDAVKTIEDIETRRINNAKSEGELIPREIVEKYVFGPMSASHTQLLQDIPKSLAIATRDAHETGQTIQEVETLIRDRISKILITVKRKADKAVK